MTYEDPNWERIAREYRHYPASLGNFHRQLCSCIMAADLKNTRKLRQIYPELVKLLKGEIDPPTPFCLHKNVDLKASLLETKHCIQKQCRHLTFTIGIIR